MTGTEIWLPKSETKVTVADGKVIVWEEMLMTLRPISKPTGFAREPGSTPAAAGGSIPAIERRPVPGP